MFGFKSKKEKQIEAEIAKNKEAQIRMMIIEEQYSQVEKLIKYNLKTTSYEKKALNGLVFDLMRYLRGNRALESVFEDKVG
jgi:hypothetical protein